MPHSIIWLETRLKKVLLLLSNKLYSGADRTIKAKNINEQLNSIKLGFGFCIMYLLGWKS